MQTIWHKITDWFRILRSKHLEPLAKFLFKIKITANLMTLISLFSGIIAAYFLFNNYKLFLIFGIIHLFGDAMDGIIARVSKPHKYGRYFDLIADRIVAVVLLLKIAYYLQDYYAYIAAALLIITQTIHFMTRLEYKALYSRTFVLIILMFNLPVLAYLAAGVISLYSLGLQFSTWLNKTF